MLGLPFFWLVMLLCLLPAEARWAQVAQEWEPYRLNESQRAWFKSIKAPNGVPCCDISDGHPTEMERCQDGKSPGDKPRGRNICGKENGIYIPDPIHLGEPRQWIKVPDEAVVKGAANPVGAATVWWVPDGPDQVHIRCFVPEAET